jgi:hypothetical protein
MNGRTTGDRQCGWILHTVCTDADGQFVFVSGIKFVKVEKAYHRRTGYVSYLANAVAVMNQRRVNLPIRITILCVCDGIVGRIFFCLAPAFSRT